MEGRGGYDYREDGVGLEGLDGSFKGSYCEISRSGGGGYGGGGVGGLESEDERGQEIATITIMDKSNCQKIYEEAMDIMGKSYLEIEANLKKTGARIKVADSEDIRMLNITKQRSISKGKEDSSGIMSSDFGSSFRKNVKINRFQIE